MISDLRKMYQPRIERLQKLIDVLSENYIRSGSTEDKTKYENAIEEMTMLKEYIIKKEGK